MKYVKDFFLFETELPEGSGFELFGACHWIWLFFILIFIIIFSNFYKNQDNNIQNRINHWIALFFISIAFYRDLILFITGHFDVGFLPFHLCSLALWIAVLYVGTKSRFLGVIYVLLCVPGAFGALLYPNWNCYPFFNYMHIHDFLSHAAIITFGISLLRSGQIRLKWIDLWRPVVFGLIGFLIISQINKHLGTNFWFLEEPSVGSPLIFISEQMGASYYQIGYFLFCLVIVAIWEGILIMLFDKRNADNV